MDKMSTRKSTGFLTPPMTRKKRKVQLSPTERKRLIAVTNTSITELRNKLAIAKHNDKPGIESQLNTEILTFIHLTRPGLKLSNKPLSQEEIDDLFRWYGGEVESTDVDDDFGYTFDFDSNDGLGPDEIEKEAMDVAEESIRQEDLTQSKVRFRL